MRHVQGIPDVDGAGSDMPALRRRGAIRLRLAFGTIALVAVTVGLLVNTFAPWLGLAAETHRAIAMAFASMGSVYGAALWWWERRA